MNEPLIIEFLVKTGFSRRHCKAELGLVPAETDFQVREWLGGKGLFLWGEPGRGKTYIAAALVREWLLKNEDRYIGMDSGERRLWRPIEYVSTVDLFQALRSSFQNKTDSYIIVEGYIRAKSLILDDIGAEIARDWTLDTLHTIIDRRYRDMRQTFIISNLSLDALAERVGDRITSRIAEMCSKVVELKGKDRRLEK